MNPFEAIVAELAAAWNAGNAERFAAPFAADAEQVNIFGAELRGREEIRERHAAIFRTIFEGSTNALRVTGVRMLTPEVALVRVESVVSVHGGPMRGELRTIISVVLQRVDARWEIVLFHNTRQERGPNVR